MVDPLISHPAVDHATPEAFIVEQDRRVAGMSTWLRDAAYTAASHQRAFQVVTPNYSRITYALEMLLRDVDGQWVVRLDRDTFLDGLNGLHLEWNGRRFAPGKRPVAPVAEPPRPGDGDLEVHVSALHAPTENLQLGDIAVAAVGCLTGHGPLGWGVAEPVTEPWSQRELTAAAHGRAPKPTHLVITGAETVGQLRVTRVDAGVHEQLRLSGWPAGAVPAEDVETLARKVAPIARSVFVSAHPARLYGLRTSNPAPPGLPYAMLVGHQIVEEHGLAHTLSAPVEPTLLETPGGPAAWFRFDRGPDRPYELLSAALGHFADLERP